MGSLVTIPEEKRLHYIEAINASPKNVGDLLLSLNTGAYLRGLAKSFNVPEEKASVIAFAVVRVAVGELAFSQLAAALVTELSLPTDQAQSMAWEIEKDLFTPIKQELKEYWAKLKNPSINPQNPPQNPSPPVPPDKGDTGGFKPASPTPPNLLNLKEQPRVPPPPPI